MNTKTCNDRTRRIALLNDAFRLTFVGGSVCITAAIHEMGPEFVEKALRTVRIDDHFDKDNDPYGEHDFGSVRVENQKLFWKIDYYAPDMIHGSEDPSNTELTRRVLTVMFAQEY